MEDDQLTRGSLLEICRGNQDSESGFFPALQVLAIKKDNLSYFLKVSDGNYVHHLAKLDYQLNHLILCNSVNEFGIIRLLDYRSVGKVSSGQATQLIRIKQIEVVKNGRDVGCVIGDATLVNLKPDGTIPNKRPVGAVKPVQSNIPKQPESKPKKDSPWNDDMKNKGLEFICGSTISRKRTSSETPPSLPNKRPSSESSSLIDPGSAEFIRAQRLKRFQIPSAPTDEAVAPVNNSETEDKHLTPNATITSTTKDRQGRVEEISEIISDNDIVETDPPSHSSESSGIPALVIGGGDIFNERRKAFQEKDTLQKLAQEEVQLKRELALIDKDIELVEMEKELKSLEFQIDLNRILEAFKEEFKCFKCEKMLQKPVMLLTCGHVYCEMCIRNHRSESEYRTCPKCNRKISQTVKSYNFENLIDTLKDDFKDVLGFKEQPIKVHRRSRLSDGGRYGMPSEFFKRFK